jgi:TolB protein
MSIVAPPDSPPVDELEALIREARARQRRRRGGAAAVVAALAALALVVWGIDRTFVGRGGSTARSQLTPVVDAHAFAGHGNLAFVSRDRLWLLDGRAGRLIRVAGAGASGPAFSPNGRWLAWSQGVKRFGIARSDGTGSHLLPSHGGGEKWLPDGRLLVGRAIYRIDHGAPVRAGLAPEGLVSWAPDGSRYAFVTESRDARRPAPYNDVARVELSASLTGSLTVWYETPESFTTRSGWQDPAIGYVAILPSGGILVWLDPFHSASIAADGLPVYEIVSPGARPRKIGVSIGTPLSLGARGRFALGAGGDRIAWTTKRVVTCASGGCRPLRAPTARMTLDPAWSPGGGRLAYVTAADLGVEVTTVGSKTMNRWYRTRRLSIGSHVVPNSTGAASPVWSADGRSLLFVARDGLWLLPRVGARPSRIATPLFWPGRWPNYFGRVDWTDQFAWWSPR